MADGVRSLIYGSTFLQGWEITILWCETVVPGGMSPIFFLFGGGHSTSSGKVLDGLCLKRSMHVFSVLVCQWGSSDYGACSLLV
ncbi:hypothetical protein F2Q70_00043380 [Brassica cretica]|uniref:Uncharacterized protein n=2 Tax=Brassica cretica TaxID=69181 RepID=A0A8S9LPG1_BRACR|nr:hypothetical protein F2Q70_00043380 [Brassica cretica]KAF2607967.1 hypothetical protein F2Q68_00044368 [Brassica cretica]KAF3519701.1 hypothetical protein DY000_02060451 [Brassica cretica]